jgi:hypothetical protein
MESLSALSSTSIVVKVLQEMLATDARRFWCPQNGRTSQFEQFYLNQLRKDSQKITGFVLNFTTGPNAFVLSIHGLLIAELRCSD